MHEIGLSRWQRLGLNYAADLEDVQGWILVLGKRFSIDVLDFFLLLRMRTSKNRSSLNTSATSNESAFRWQQCSQCLKSMPSTSENHQCSDELNGFFVENNRARLLVQEHKSGSSRDREAEQLH